MHIRSTISLVLLLLTLVHIVVAQTRPPANLAFSTAACAAVSIRKEWRTLTSEEQQKYIDAVVTLRNSPGLSRRVSDEWASFILQHETVRRTAHNSTRFLPWHRGFVRLWELALQAIDPTIIQPYWDWTMDSSNPAGSKVFSDFGGASQRAGEGPVQGSGRPGPDAPGPECIEATKFATIRQSYPDNNTCIARVHPVSFHDLNTVANLLKITDFAVFSQQLESIHGSVHVQLGGFAQPGGPTGYMSDVAHSPHDPLFMMHHAQVDRIFAMWQKENPNSPYPNPTEVLSSTDITLSTWTAASVWDITAPPLCYSYDTSVRPKSFVIATASSGAAAQGSGSSSSASHCSIFSGHVSSLYGVNGFGLHRGPARSSHRFGHHLSHEERVREAFMANIERERVARMGRFHNHHLRFLSHAAAAGANPSLPSYIDPSKTPQGYDGRTDPNKLTLVPPLPDWYIDDVGLPRALVRSFEHIWGLIVEFVNSITGYRDISCYAVAEESGFEYVQMTPEEEAALWKEKSCIVEGFIEVWKKLQRDLAAHGGDWMATIGDEVEAGSRWLREHAGARGRGVMGRPSAKRFEGGGDDIIVDL
ncbi:hypothetical protein BJ742DRAFT_834780 [Cladochytrium replicatum]|nr:hypothetical protein BJ742DRAFT_834780 [Cladochytrium replicatum]